MAEEGQTVMSAFKRPTWHWKKTFVLSPKIHRGLEKCESIEGPTGTNKSLGHHYLTACYLHILWKYISMWYGWRWWVTPCCRRGRWWRQGIIPLYSLDHIGYSIQFWAPWYTGKALVNGNKFSGEPERWLGALALWGCDEGVGLVQPGEEVTWGAPNSHLPPARRPSWHVLGSLPTSWGPSPPEWLH